MAIPAGPERNGKGHERGDGIEKALEEGHHGAHDAGEERLLRRPLGVALGGGLLGGGGELPFPEVLVGLHDALLQKPHHGGHHHVILGIHAGAGDRVEGKLDLACHIPRGGEAHLRLEIS